MLELLHALETFARMFEHPATGNQQGARARVFQNELNLLDRLRGVDGYRNAAEAEDSEIRYRPLGPILGNQRHAIAGVQTEVDEAERDVAHATQKLGG